MPRTPLAPTEVESRRKTFLISLLATAIVIPLTLMLYTRYRVRSGLVPALHQATSRDVRVGDVELALFGTLRIYDLSIGSKEQPLLEVAKLEASVGMQTLMRGEFAADEIRVVGPRIVARVLEDGNLDLANVLTRLRDTRRKQRANQPQAQEKHSRLRRIVLSGGELVIAIPGYGHVRARGVELYPHRGGMRYVSSTVDALVEKGGVRARLSFGRVALDVSLPSLRLSRAALDGGRLSLLSDSDPLFMTQAVLAHQGGHKSFTHFRAKFGEHGRKGSVSLERDAIGVVHGEINTTDLPLAPLAALTKGWLDIDDARISGNASLRYEPAVVLVHTDASLQLQGSKVTTKLVSQMPLPIDGTVELTGSYNLAQHSANGIATLSSRSIVLGVRGQYAAGPGGRPQRADLEITLAKTACARIASSLPSPLRARLAGLETSGTLAAHITTRFDVQRKARPELAIDLDMRCSASAEPSRSNVGLLANGFVHKLPSGKPRQLSTSDPNYVALNTLPRHVAQAFVAGEDARFFDHAGFDLKQVRLSYAVNIRAGRVARGGSTISQQLVKNLYLKRSRDLARKFIEAVLTWRLEARVTKRRILEIYLNIIELGLDVYGIAPASHRWFGKQPRRLTLVEAAFLAALTPAPRSTERRLLEAGRLDKKTLGRVHAVLRSMRRNRWISQSAYAKAIAARPAVRLR